MSFSFIVVPSSLKVAPKSFSNLGLVLEKPTNRIVGSRSYRTWKAYALVQDPHFVMTNYTFKVIIIESQCLDIFYLPNPIGLVSIHLHRRLMLRTLRKIDTSKKTLPKLVPQLSATNIKVKSMLLPTVQTHLTLPSMMELPLKHLSRIIYSSESHSVIKEFSVFFFRLPRLLSFFNTTTVNYPLLFLALLSL